MHLYHIVPNHLVGTNLVSLNELRNISIAEYNKVVAKYKGREELMKVEIPPLKCLWNDVVFLTAVHPSILARAYERAGGTLRKHAFYQIDARKLDRVKMTVILYEDAPEAVRTFVPFYLQNLAQYAAMLPASTVEYYRQELKAGRRPLIFHRIPHILFKGSIDVSNAPIISL